MSGQIRCSGSGKIVKTCFLLLLLLLLLLRDLMALVRIIFFVKFENDRHVRCELTEESKLTMREEFP